MAIDFTHKNVKAKGIAYWAKIQMPDPDYNIYSIDVVVDKETHEELQSYGLSPRRNQEGKLVAYEGHKGVVYQFRRKGDFDPPVIVDAKLTTFTGLVGNGSEVIISFNVGVSSYKKKKFTKAYLDGVQVLTLVPYERKPKASSLFDEEEGEDISQYNNPEPQVSADKDTDAEDVFDDDDSPF